MARFVSFLLKKMNLSLIERYVNEILLTISETSL